jgi:nucleolar GTP-binding protein
VKRLPREEAAWDPSIIAKRLHVPTYEEVLEKIKSRYPRRRHYKSLLDAELARLQMVHDIIITKTNFIKDLVGLLDNIHPFFKSLIEIEFDIGEIRDSIRCVAKSRKLAGKFWDRYRYMLLASETPDEIRRVAAEARGRMLSQLKRCRKALDTLRSLAIFLSKLPAVDPSLRTIIVAGAPSTGKSSFVSSASRARPRVSPFPFTTRGIHVGHHYIGDLKLQIIDTPGLLDRPPEDMNPIERRAIAALSHIPGSILLLVDVSDSPTIDVERQFKILDLLGDVIKDKNIYVMLNKIDIADKENLSIARKLASKAWVRGLVREFFEGTATDPESVRKVIKAISLREGWIQA